MQTSYKHVCSNCIKKEVCKFVNKFQDLRADLLKAPLGTDGYTMADETSNPFNVTLECIYFSAKCRESVRQNVNGLNVDGYRKITLNPQNIQNKEEDL